MNILITGTSGFIGSNFLYYNLKKKFNKIICIDIIKDKELENNIKKYNKNVLFVKCNIGNSKLIKKILIKFKPQYVINFAAETHVDNSIRKSKNFIRSNIINSYNFLLNTFEYWQNLDKIKKRKFIFLNISTDEVYGHLKNTRENFNINSNIKPNNPYSASKASFDHILSSFFVTYSFPMIISRCSNNYGPRQFPEKLIPLVLHNCITNLPIPVYGNGTNIRDWIYVEDHCEAIFKILKKGKIGSVYNIGSNNKISNIKLVKKICQFLDIEYPKRNSYSRQIKFVKDRLGHDFAYGIDTKHINKELGWLAKTSFNVGLAKTIRWYMKNSKWLIKKRKKILIKNH